MTIYVALINDRHSEPGVRAFSKADKAIAFCRREVKELAFHPTEIVEREVEGWLWYAKYSPENDYAFVTAVELDDEG